MSARDIELPPGADVRSSMKAGLSFVTIAPPGLPADFTSAIKACAPAVHQLLTHDAGISWPDRMGCRLANNVLARGDGLVVAQFETLADALAFRKKLGDAPPLSSAPC